MKGRQGTCGIWGCLTSRETAGPGQHGSRRNGDILYERNVDFPHPGSPRRRMDTVVESPSSMSDAEMLVERR